MTTRPLTVRVAHAAAAPFDELDIAVIDVPTLRLDQRTDRQRLQETAPEPDTAEQRIVEILSEAETPLSQRQIRERAASRAATVAAALQTLIRERRVERAPKGGYRIARADAEGAPAAANGKHRDHDDQHHKPDRARHCRSVLRRSTLHHAKLSK